MAIPTQGQERVRKTSLDLRREIIDVGGIQNLIQLRKKRKQKKREALAASQEPPPEPEEIVRVLGRTPVWAGEAGEGGMAQITAERPPGTAFALSRLAPWTRRHS